MVVVVVVAAPPGTTTLVPDVGADVVVPTALAFALRAPHGFALVVVVEVVDVVVVVGAADVVAAPGAACVPVPAPSALLTAQGFIFVPAAVLAGPLVVVVVVVVTTVVVRAGILCAAAAGTAVLVLNAPAGVGVVTVGVAAAG